jgi:hypothetical protein
MKDKLYPDISVSENAQKGFFRRVPGSLQKGTPTSLYLLEMRMGLYQEFGLAFLAEVFFLR